MAVGPVLGADGTTPATGRQGKTGEATVGQAHGKYYEPASRGVLFCGSDQGVGVTAQVTITTVATMSLHNPVNSGKRIAIKKVSIGYFSGTLPAGAWYHGALPSGSTLPSGGTTMGNLSLSVGNVSGVSPVGVALSGSTVVSCASHVLYPFASSAPILASTAVPQPMWIEDVDGAIVLEPGAQYQLLGVHGGTGSTPKVSLGIIWEEIPLVTGQG